VRLVKGKIAISLKRPFQTIAKREMTHREKLVWMAQQQSPGEARHFS
jgi:rubrerythrin